METFPERLRRLRKGYGLTQEDLAKMVGVNKQTISQYERGVRRPDLEMLTRLSERLGTTTDYLVGKTDRLPFLLTEDERAIIQEYRCMDDNLQQMAIRFFEYMRSIRGGGKHA